MYEVLYREVATMLETGGRQSLPALPKLGHLLHSDAPAIRSCNDPTWLLDIGVVHPLLRASSVSPSMPWGLAVDA